jgi:hypothetical protein
MSVNDLLDQWTNSARPKLLASHVQYLQQRYRLELGASGAAASSSMLA